MSNLEPTGNASADYATIVAIDVDVPTPRGRAKMTPAERDERVYATVSELIEEAGAANVTIKSIAARMGVSRQWLYKFYPDIDAIYAVVYEHGRARYLHDDVAPPTDLVARVEFLKRRAARFLELPMACAVVGSLALNYGIRVTDDEQSLRNQMLLKLERGWVAPMVEVGYDRDELFGSLLSFMNVLFGLVIAMNQGFTTKEVAQERLHALLDAVVSNNALSSGVPMGAA